MPTLNNSRTSISLPSLAQRSTLRTSLPFILITSTPPLPFSISEYLSECRRRSHRRHSGTNPRPKRAPLSLAA
ncbi:hypothetical protein E2C01_066558 [Portunus trituberculatus]|uniref:Uncharacterized protein n=1 Tax=Portunus trituberculatus TaxID=210409 RepID=A0A5B7HIH3_PORTR|nr:hypothetical protein [Portunus trituberculatus]